MAFLKPMVKESTATTGTGAYTLLGRYGDAPQFRTFEEAFGLLGQAYYIVTQGTSYEFGLGTLNADGTLGRLVIGSSSGGAAVNWGAGTKPITCAIPSSVCLNNNTEVFTQGDTTPSVLGANVWRANDSSANTITRFDDAIEGQVITIIFLTGNTTLQHNSTIKLSGGSNFTGAANETIQLVCVNYNGTGPVFYEVTRSTGNG